MPRLSQTSLMNVDESPCPEIFRPQDFFNGPLAASGMFVDRFGKVQRRFVADVDCTETADGFILDEDFLFDDGVREQRQWVITRQSDSLYHGQCDDVDGIATGRLHGPALHWRYDFYLVLSGRRVKVRFHDLMVLQSSDTVLNRARVTKFGLLLGEVFITFQRKAGALAS